MVVRARLAALRDLAKTGPMMVVRFSQGAAGRTKVKITTGASTSQNTDGQVDFTTQLLEWFETRIDAMVVTDHGHKHSSGGTEVVMYLGPTEQEGAGAEPAAEPTKPSRGAEHEGTTALDAEAPAAHGGLDQAVPFEAEEELLDEGEAVTDKTATETDEEMAVDANDYDSGDLDQYEDIAAEVEGSVEVRVQLQHILDSIQTNPDETMSIGATACSIRRVQQLLRKGDERHEQFLRKHMAFAQAEDSDASTDNQNSEGG